MTHDQTQESSHEHLQGHADKHEGECCGGHEADLREFASQPDGSYLIAGDMIIGDVVAAFPQAVPVMLSYGLHCVGCHAQAFDTIEDGSRGHGMPDEEIARMIDEINIAVNHRIDTIEFTDKAVEKVLELRKLEQGKEDWPLRITVTAGGCSGFSYDMDFGTGRPDDVTLEFNGLTVLIDPESMPLIKGSRIDFVDSLQGSGFKIENPNRSKCVCGKNSC